LLGAGIQGVVRDEAGQAVSGVSILAMGATLNAVRTDSRGRFLLLLAPGEYILRVAREGYLSTVREPIRVHGQPIERDITLTRVAGPATQSDGEATGEPNKTDHSHSELAWRLRHMARSALRERSGVAVPEVVEPARADGFTAAPSLFDWVIESSARAASSFFAETDFHGQLNLLTTSMMPGGADALPVTWPRGVASVIVGAPIGSHGNWSVRAAMAADERASWTLLGDYQTDADRAHAFRLGVSFSSQDSVTALAALPSIAAPGSRRVGGAYVFDRWRVRPDVTFEYGLRIDRYDYLAETGLLSPSAGVSVRLTPEATVIARASRRLAAPGAAEFLPPSASGPWLPPQRTFSTLTPDAPLHREAVERYELGFEYAIRWPAAATLRVGRQVESVEGQVATLFGADAGSDVGHYFVATAGDPHLEAWVVGLESDLGPHARAALTYTRGQSRWRDLHPESVLLSAGAHPRTGRIDDLTLSFDGRLPRTSTELTMAYRVNTDLVQEDRVDRPAAGGRFNLEIRQQLLYRPSGGGRLDLLIGVRTLLTPLADQVSFYDELLTVAPPTRLVCGLQVGF
jgi:hypothetical protein